MKACKVFLIVAIVLALVASSLTAPPARAMSDTGEAALIAGAVVGGIILIAVVGTMLTRNNPSFLRNGDPSMPQNILRSDSRVHYGADCPGGANSAILCW